MKSHVEFQKCVVHKNMYGQLCLSVGNAVTIDGPRKKGEELNPDLIKGSLGPQFRDWVNCAEPGAKIEVGDLNVGVGAMPIILGSDAGRCPLDIINFPNDSTRDIYIGARIISKFHSIPIALAIAVIRDWFAPRTYGWLEGGAAGVLEATTKAESRVYVPLGVGEIVRAINYDIFMEFAQEIGIGVLSEAGDLEWVGFRNMPWLTNIAREAWNETGTPKQYVGLKELRGPDSVVFGELDYHEAERYVALDNVSLAFETMDNATVELLRIFALDFDPDYQYAFIDREKAGGRHINRKIALVGFGAPGDVDFSVYFQNGAFDTLTPGCMIDEGFLEYSCNPKFTKLYRVIKQYLATA